MSTDSYGNLRFTKHLRTLAHHCGRPFCRCLIVDDTPDTYRYNQSHALPIRSYQGETVDDGALSELKDFLLMMTTPGLPLDVRGYALAPPAARPLITEEVDGIDFFLWHHVRSPSAHVPKTPRGRGRRRNPKPS